jgi:hypothetical protein
MFKEYYPIRPVDKNYDYEMSLLMTFQTSKVTYNNTYLEIDLPEEISINSGFDPAEVDLVNNLTLAQY